MRLLQRIALLPAAVLFAAFAGCGGSSAPIVLNPSGLPTLGELEQMIQDSTAPDSDGDYIPDDVETNTLKTNPLDRDTDHDGLPDNYEIFGEGIFDPDAYVPDMDLDRVIAPRDKDDDGDFINDGLAIDTDGDLVANYLEYYGYTYDWLTGRFVSCEDVDCTGVTIYKSDPLQRSTDQDSYSDSTEVSGLSMDPSVDQPGQHPLVPAYPELVVELVGYSCTLNEDLTFSHGESLSQGTEWSRETSMSHSFTAEVNWKGGVEAGGEDIFKVNTEIGLGFGYTYETTNTTSTGSSIVSEKSWEEARSVNPTDAARIKLFLKVHNRGTACASNIVPTLTLRIAGLNVSTFEPGNAQINLLVPGATYPAEDGVFWVLDKAADGTPLSLTMRELRALERGAPVGITLTQARSDVMVLNEAGGWESVGDSGEALARCDAACADLRLDMGDGFTMHRMVYCGTGPSEPVVTLRDALEWTAGATQDQTGYRLAYLDNDGLPQETSLKGWSFAFDRATLVGNGFDPDDLGAKMTADYDIGDLLLFPNSVVIGKAPRQALELAPTIHFASIDEDTRTATVCATDYRGVEEVVVYVSTDGGVNSLEWSMEPDTAEASLYTLVFNDAQWQTVSGIMERELDPGSGQDDILKAIATSVDGVKTERPFTQIVPQPRPVSPVIEAVTLDIPNGRLYARVVPNPKYPQTWYDAFGVEWVRAIHDAFPLGYLELLPPANYYEDPYGYVADLPAGWVLADLKIVALVQPGVWTEARVQNVVEAHNQGIGYLEVKRVAYLFDSDISLFSLDVDSGYRRYYTFHADSGNTLWNLNWNPPRSEVDFYLTPSNDDRVMLFNVPYLKWGSAGREAFNSITKADVDAFCPASLPKYGGNNDAVGEEEPIDEQTIYIFRTSAGRLGKMMFTKKVYLERLGFFNYTYVWTANFDYIVFKN